MNTEALAAVPAKWANPPANLVSKIPRGGVQLDYMGHADVTLALIEIDPTFDYGWLTNDDGSMLIRNVDGRRLVLEGWLTVHGVKRLCVGTCEAKKFEPEKELIGDLLRNGAMRFGVATGLWSKSDPHDSTDSNDTEFDTGTGDRIAAVFSALPKLTPAQRKNLNAWAATQGRPINSTAMRGDEDFLAGVETWLAENRVAS